MNKKMTKQELKNYIISEAKKLMKEYEENFGDDFERDSRSIEYGINPYGEEQEIDNNELKDKLKSMIIDHAMRMHTITYYSSIYPVPIWDYYGGQGDSKLSEHIKSQLPDLFKQDLSPREVLDKVFDILGNDVYVFDFGWDKREASHYHLDALKKAKAQGARLVVMRYLS